MSTYGRAVLKGSSPLPVAVERVRPSHQDSYERLCHDSGVPRFMLNPADDEAGVPDTYPFAP